MLKFLVFALCAAPLAAAPAAEKTDTGGSAIEAEIRKELSSLRARLLKLEAMLDSLREDGEPEAVADAEPSVELVRDSAPESAPIDAATVAAKLGDPKPVWTAPAVVSDAEPSEEMPVGVASSGGQLISFTGLLDAYYSYNTNSPSNGYNDLYYTNPNARGFGLNQAKLEIDASGDGPIGFRTDIWFWFRRSPVRIGAERRSGYRKGSISSRRTATTSSTMGLSLTWVCLAPLRDWRWRSPT